MAELVLIELIRFLPWCFVSVPPNYGLNYCCCFRFSCLTAWAVASICSVAVYTSQAESFGLVCQIVRFLRLLLVAEDNIYVFEGRHFVMKCSRLIGSFMGRRVRAPHFSFVLSQIAFCTIIFPIE